MMMIGIRGLASAVVAVLLLHPGPALIGNFGKERFGAPLFFPNSAEYRKAAGLPAGDF